MIVIRSRAPAETRAIGEALGRALGLAAPHAPAGGRTGARGQSGPGAVLAIDGPLGAGKTCLVQGLARGLGVSGYIRSPTFVIVHEHPGPVPLHHVDLYRLTAADLDGLGLEELFDGPGVTAIEWAERAEATPPGGRLGLLPPEHLRVSVAFGPADDDREISLEARGDRYRRIVEDIACAFSR